jgi:O-antigen ligase
VWLVVAAAAAGVAAVEPRLVAPVAALVAGVIAWRFPDGIVHLLVFGVLAVRPSLDAFSQRGIGIGPAALSPAVLFGLVVAWLGGVVALRRARDGPRWWTVSELRGPHLWLLAAYGVMVSSGARLYAGTGLAEGVRELVRVASLLAGLLVVLWWVEGRPERIRRGWAYLALGLAVPVGVGLSQWVTGSGYVLTEGLNRLQGTFSHPNAYGPYLTLFVLVATAQALAAAGRRRILYVAAAAALAFLVTQTFSRTALLMLGTGLAVLPLIGAPRLRARALIRPLLGVVVVAGLAWLAFGDLVRERFADIDLRGQAWQAALEGQAENSFQWRVVNWAVLLSLGMEHPLTGHGAGMTTVLNPIVSSENGVPYNAHNDLVRFFFEGGAVGLALYLGYCVLLGVWLIRAARRSGLARNPALTAVAAAFWSLTLLTAGMAEVSLQTAVLTQFYGMLGLAAGALIPPQAEAHTAAIGPPRS